MINKFDDTKEGFYKPQEIAMILRISYSHCIELLQEGKIKGIRIGRLWRISEQELNRILNEGI